MRKAILHLKKADPVMRAIIERVGAYKIQHREPSFETLVRSIVYQQLSGKVASVILGRLIAMLPDGKVTPAGHSEADSGAHAQGRTIQAKDRLYSRSGAQNE